MKIEGAERGKEKVTAPAATTTAPDQPASPAAIVGFSRHARPHGAPAVGWAATACPVGVWCGAPMSRPRPGWMSSGRRVGDQGTERGSGRGKGDGGGERERQPGHEQGQYDP